MLFQRSRKASPTLFLLSRRRVECMLCTVPRYKSSGENRHQSYHDDEVDNFSSWYMFIDGARLFLFLYISFPKADQSEWLIVIVVFCS